MVMNAYSEVEAAWGGEASDPGGKQVLATAGRPEHGEFLRAGLVVTSSALNDLVVELCARILGDFDLEAPREGSRTE